MADQAKLIVEVRWGLAPSMISGRWSKGVNSDEWEKTHPSNRQALIDSRIREAMELMETYVNDVPQSMNYVGLEVIWL